MRRPTSGRRRAARSVRASSHLRAVASRARRRAGHACINRRARQPSSRPRKGKARPRRSPPPRRSQPRFRELEPLEHCPGALAFIVHPRASERGALGRRSARSRFSSGVATWVTLSHRSQARAEQTKVVYSCTRVRQDEGMDVGHARGRRGREGRGRSGEGTRRGRRGRGERSRPWRLIRQ